MRLSLWGALNRRTITAWLATVAMIAAVMVAVTASRAQAVATPVPLGTAGTYAVLAGQSITNTGPSVITGDVGVSPGTAISGFPPDWSTGPLTRQMAQP